MTTDDQFSAMLIVDVFVANLWMPFLLVGAGMSAALDRRLKADASAVDELKKKVEAFQLGIARVPSFTDLIIGGVAFGSVALAHVSRMCSDRHSKGGSAASSSATPTASFNS